MNGLFKWSIHMQNYDSFTSTSDSHAISNPMEFQ